MTMVKNNYLKIRFIVGLIIFCSSCSVHKVPDHSKLKYLTLVANRWNKNKAHIELQYTDKITLDSSEFFLPQDDRDIIARLNYNTNAQIAILKEYLFFQGFKQLSDKGYAFHIGNTKNRVTIADQKIPVTIEVEALYAINIMLLDYSVSISPALINTSTGVACNGNEKEMKEIFDIYKKWLRKTEKNGFKDLTWPLVGSKYKWLGRDEVKIVLRSSL